MKPLSYLKLAVLAMPILLGGCKSTKSIVKEPAVKAPVDTVAASHLRKVSDNSILTKFVQVPDRIAAISSLASSNRSNSSLWSAASLSESI